MIAGVLRKAGLLLVALLAGGVSAARADGDIVTYECTLEQHAANNGWLAEKVIVVHTPWYGEAIVSDALLDRFLGRDAKAKAEADNDKRVTFVWDLTAKGSTGKQQRTVYRLTVMKATLAAVMSTTRMVGYTNQVLTTQGTCRRIKG